MPIYTCPYACIYVSMYTPRQTCLGDADDVAVYEAQRDVDARAQAAPEEQLGRMLLVVRQSRPDIRQSMPDIRQSRHI